MSYCVNCGVKLAESEKSCPLCHCPVVNPMDSECSPEKLEHPYPKRRDTIKNIIDRKFIISVMSIIYLLPIVICIAVDTLLRGRMTWSVISTVSVVLCWVIVFLPYLLDKELAMFYTSIDLIVLVGLFFSIAWYVGNYRWVWGIAIPTAILAYVIINVTVYGVSRGFLHNLYTGAFVLGATGIFCVILEVLIWNYIRRFLDPARNFEYWSAYVFISCIIIAGLLCYIERKKTLKRGLEKRFHI